MIIWNALVMSTQFTFETDSVYAHTHTHTHTMKLVTPQKKKTKNLRKNLHGFKTTGHLFG